ncbi:MAG: hypothetical protein ACLPIG_13855, partial [Methylocella sp.]
DHGLLRRWMAAPLILQGAAAMSMERLEAGIFQARRVIQFRIRRKRDVAISFIFSNPFWRESYPGIDLMGLTLLN